MTIQEKYEELAKKLTELTICRKAKEEERSRQMAPLQEKVKEVISLFQADFMHLAGQESELRKQMAELYREAKEVRKKAYAEACAAQDAGDIEGVVIATTKSLNSLITPNSNVYFRSGTDYEIEDESVIPDEFYTVDWGKVRASETDIPGVRKIEYPIVVVKT